MRHREGLTRAGDPEQNLVLLTARETFAQFVDCLWLVAGRLELRAQLKRLADIVLRTFGDK
jgi:hypothetical protein